MAAPYTPWTTQRQARDNIGMAAMADYYGGKWGRKGPPRPSPMAGIPRGAKRVKAAEWYMWPDYAKNEVMYGLGRYGRRRRSYRSRRAPKRATRRRYTRRRRSTYKRRRTYGRGGFFSTLGKLASGVVGDIGKIGGEAIGSLVGHPGIGGSIGGALGHGLGKLLGGGPYHAVGPSGVPAFMGTGAYRASGPSGVPTFMGTGPYMAHGPSGTPAYIGRGAYQALTSEPGVNMAAPGNIVQALEDSVTMKQEIPVIINAGEGDIIIRHREYVADIVSIGNQFSLVANIQLNPGLAPEDGGAFPWLSGIARHFQQYRFEGLVWQFVSTSGTYGGASQALGEVIFSTNYNVSAPPPVNKQEMLSQIFSTSKVPAADFEHPVETNPKDTVLNGKLYVRGGPLEPDVDPRFYDMAETNIATQGQTVAIPGDTVTLGELWITYQCSLSKPQIPSVSRQNTNTSRTGHYQNATTTTTSFMSLTANMFNFGQPNAVIEDGGGIWDFSGTNGLNRIDIGRGVTGTFLVQMTAVMAGAVPLSTQLFWELESTAAGAPPGTSANVSGFTINRILPFLATGSPIGAPPGGLLASPALIPPFADVVSNTVLGIMWLIDVDTTTIPVGTVGNLSFRPSAPPFTTGVTMRQVDIRITEVDINELESFNQPQATTL